MTGTNTAQLVADLGAADEAVRANGWVAPGLGMPGAPMGLLGSTLNPLTGLATAGLGWFLPFVSFLGEGLAQLQGGNAGSVASGAQAFGSAGQDIAGVAGSYRESTSAQTSDWSGTAASQYRDAGARHADGVAGLGQASNTVGSAIIGAGQVVAQAIAEVTELIAEAVAQIVPIMSQAVARAGETFGQSIVEAIPPCVGIAVEYALRIVAKLAALAASGDNLLKLVQGAMAIVDLIQQALSGISGRSVRPDSDPPAGGLPDGGPASAMDAVASGSALAAGVSPAAGSSAPSSVSPASVPSAGGPGGGVAMPAGSVDPQGTHSWTPRATYSPEVLPPSQGTGPDAARTPGSAGGVSASAAPGAGMPVAPVGSGPAAGARADAVREDGRPQPARVPGTGVAPGGVPGGVPMGALGAGRAGDVADQEHERKYGVFEMHDEDLEVAPPVITSSGEEA